MRIAIAGPVEVQRFAADLNCDVPQHYAFPLIGELAEALRSRGHHVSIVTTSRQITKRWSASAERLDVVIVPDVRRPRDKVRDRFATERRMIRAELESFNTDVVNAHWLYEFGAAAGDMDGAVCLVAHDRPLDVLRWHAHPYWAARISLGFVSRHRGTSIGAVAPAVAQQITKVFRIRSEIEILPNWSFAARAFAGKRQYSEGGHIVATVLNGDGSLKNPRSALEAFKIVRGQVPSARLVMFGAGHNDRDPLANWARSSRLADGVEFRGTVDHRALLRFLASEADVFLHPSRTEACSVAVVEAMSLGLPIVAGSNSGGIPWQLDHGRAGILTDVNHPRTIAQAVVELLGNVRLREMLGAAARNRSQTLFDPDVSVSRYEEWFKRCVANV